MLAAHFLRRGQLIPGVFCVVMTALVFVRQPWARRIWQGFLGIGVLIWLGTLSRVARLRMEQHEHWLRPAVILLAVAAFTLLAALLLEHRRVYARYQGHGGAPPAA